MYSLDILLFLFGTSLLFHVQFCCFLTCIQVSQEACCWVCANKWACDWNLEIWSRLVIWILSRVVQSQKQQLKLMYSRSIALMVIVSSLIVVQFLSLVLQGSLSVSGNSSIFCFIFFSFSLFLVACFSLAYNQRALTDGACLTTSPATCPSLFHIPYHLLPKMLK